MTGTNLHMASQQWATRPDDQRYLSLAELKDAVLNRRNESWTATPNIRDLEILPDRNNDLRVKVYDPTRGEDVALGMTHWSFAQMAQYASAPAGYIRSLPAELAAINLQWGIDHKPLRDNGLLLAQSNGDERLRALTSVSYGRIWDSQVVEAVERVNENGQWQIPAATYTTQNPKRATTLYASDRDVFIFLVDPNNPIEVDGETLYRGFYVWNSEVGASVFGLTTFLYRYVCDNRIIWGATNIKELRIRHTGGAPERFGYEGKKYLARYANESTEKIVDGIIRAKNTSIPNNEEAGETVADWLCRRGFSKGEAEASVTTAIAEEGEARSVWNIVNGITAYARSITHTDERIALEARAGKLLADAVR